MATSEATVSGYTEFIDSSDTTVPETTAITLKETSATATSTVVVTSSEIPTNSTRGNTDSNDLPIIIGGGVGGAVVLVVIIVVIVLVKRNVIRCRKPQPRPTQRRPTMLPNPSETNSPESVEEGQSDTGIPKVYYLDTPRSQEPGYSQVTSDPVPDTAHDPTSQYSLAKDPDSGVRPQKTTKPNYSDVRMAKDIKQAMNFSNPGYQVDPEQENYEELVRTPVVEPKQPASRPTPTPQRTERSIPKPQRTERPTPIPQRTLRPTPTPQLTERPVKDHSAVAKEDSNQHISELLYENPKRLREAMAIGYNGVDVGLGGMDEGYTGENNGPSSHHPNPAAPSTPRAGKPRRQVPDPPAAPSSTQSNRDNKQIIEDDEDQELYYDFKNPPQIPSSHNTQSNRDKPHPEDDDDQQIYYDYEKQPEMESSHHTQSNRDKLHDEDDDDQQIYYDYRQPQVGTEPSELEETEQEYYMNYDELNKNTNFSETSGSRSSPRRQRSRVRTMYADDEQRDLVTENEQLPPYYNYNAPLRERIPSADLSDEEAKEATLGTSNLEMELKRSLQQFQSTRR